jgi:hypothetical protein
MGAQTGAWPLGIKPFAGFISWETLLVIMVIMNLIGLTITAYIILKRK